MLSAAGHPLLVIHGMLLPTLTLQKEFDLLCALVFYQGNLIPGMRRLCRLRSSAEQFGFWMYIGDIFKSTDKEVEFILLEIMPQFSLLLQAGKGKGDGCCLKRRPVLCSGAVVSWS